MCVITASLSPVCLCLMSECRVCVCVSVCVFSWQPLRARVSLVEFRSIKQFRHLHGLLLRAEDPKKCPNAVQKPGALLTNICSHCEPLACDTTLYERETHTHTRPRANTYTPNTMPRLIYHFSNISGKWQPVGNVCSCCLFCLTGFAAQAFSAPLKGYTTEFMVDGFQFV